MGKYAAFLLGINVGKRQVKMDTLRKTFEELGFQNVKTLLASGNVVFDSKESKKDVLKNLIEEKLAKTFGFEIKVILRKFKEIQNLVTSNPFKDIHVTPQTRLFVTFVTGKPKEQLKSSDKNFQILSVSDSEVLSVLTLFKTTDAMNVLSKAYGSPREAGKSITPEIGILF